MERTTVKITKGYPFDISKCLVVWDVETTALIDRKRVPIKDMEISVACALVFDIADNKLEKTFKKSFWHSSVIATHGMADLCQLLAGCRAHVAYNGVRFDMLVLDKHFESDEQRQIANRKLHDPLQDVSSISYYSLNALLAENNLGSKTASGKEAPGMWASNRLEDLESYCMSDVELLAKLITKAPTVKLPMMNARVPLSISQIIFPNDFMSAGVLRYDADNGDNGDSGKT